MLLLIVSFFGGMLTVLAPCILALLPVIVGGSISGNIHDKRRPIIITASLAASLILFTLLLKATTVFTAIPPQVFTYISGAIIIILGISLLIPDLYEKFILAFNLQAKSQQLLGKGAGKGPIISAIITGAALGPVFSSCSPIYVYLIATILPVNFGQAFIYIIVYTLGLSIMLLLIGFIGQRFVRKIKFAANPRGWFQRVIAVLFIVVGLLVATGFDKKLQTYVSETTPFNFDALSASLIPVNNAPTEDGVLNVKPVEAPEFVGLENWINSKPLTIAGLKSKVVLVDFWTYSCINCIRTQPYLKDWHATYKDSGLVIVGVHAPEFAFEKVPANVEKAARSAGLEYPIALDNDFATWNAYQNSYWPASYLIDREGKIRRVHYGEGEYKETEMAIRSLLAADGTKIPDSMTNALNSEPSFVEKQTPETYLGSQRAYKLGNYVGSPKLNNGTADFTAGDLSRVNNWTLDGIWEVNGEGIVAKDNARLKIRVAAKDVFIVPGNTNNKAKMRVLLDGKPISQTGFAGADVKDSVATLTSAELYRLVAYPQFKADSTLELEVPAGVQLNVFTFGS